MALSFGRLIPATLTVRVVLQQIPTMSRARRRLAPRLQPRPCSWSLLRALPILSLSLQLLLGPAAWAKETNKTICCRSSGGTRGTCLNVWAHLVPPSNRFNPGSSRSIALLQGTSPEPTSMTLQLSTLTGDPVGEQMLPARSVGVRLIKLPEPDRPALNQPLVWESFPTCRPNKPPTRSSLVLDTTQEHSLSQKALADLRKSCGGVVDTAPLLSTFGMEEFSAKLPAKLPVHCETLTIGSLGIR
jgi:hypothetical protein